MSDEQRPSLARELTVRFEQNELLDFFDGFAPLPYPATKDDDDCDGLRDNTRVQADYRTCVA